MIRTIGLLELTSVARGIEATDFMLKAAEVDLLRANSICPGKYIVLISGDVGAVKASIEVGLEIGREYVIDSLVLPRVHPQLIKAINGTTEIDELKALGVLEFFSITASIMAADVAAKAALVDLIELRLGFAVGGKAFVTLTGDVSSVREAIEAGAKVGKEIGMLVDKVIIPSPRKELLDELM